MYLLDTNILSELRKRRRDSNVIAWIASVAPADLFLSVMTIAKIERGIERQRAANAAFADDLAGWLDMTLRAYGEHILPLTVNIARRWGRLSAQIGNQGIGIAIAATALAHGLTVVTATCPISSRYFRYKYLI